MLNEYFNMWLQLMRRYEIWFTSMVPVLSSAGTGIIFTSSLSRLWTGSVIYIQVFKLQRMHYRNVCYPDFQLLQQFKVTYTVWLLFNISFQTDVNSNCLTRLVYLLHFLLDHKISLVYWQKQRDVPHAKLCSLPSTHVTLWSTELCSQDSTSFSKRLLLTVYRLLLWG